MKLKIKNKNKNLISSMSVEEQIFALKVNTANAVRKTISIGRTAPVKTAFLWMFGALSAASFLIAVTSPFDGYRLQANTMQTVKAETIPMMQNALEIMPIGEYVEQRHAVVGQENVLLAQIEVRSGDENVTITGIDACVRDAQDGLMTGELEVFVDDLLYKSGSVLLTANSGKRISIVSDVSPAALVGSRIEAGLCGIKKISSGNNKVEIEHLLPIYDAPVSIVSN